MNDARLLVVASIGDTITCPGCGERVYLSPMDGWRNDSAGYTCRGRTSHTDHIETVIA